MQFSIDEVPVLFPYDHIYPEQYQYMLQLKRSLDSKGPALLEMPSGTGKTITLLSFIIAYQSIHPERSKLVYCTRTVPEIEKTLCELDRLIKFRESATGAKMSSFLAVGLSARKNLCINEAVCSQPSGRLVDSLCQNRTASWISSAERKEGCDFFDQLESSETSLAGGVFTLDGLVKFGRERGVCPYFLARKALERANVIVYSFAYLLDPKISAHVSNGFPSGTIVVFDEAHNIDNACIESMSLHLTKQTLDLSLKGVSELSGKVAEAKKKDASLLQREYEVLVKALTATTALEAPIGNPVMPQDLLSEAVPGSIRKAEHFLSFLRRLAEYLRTKFRSLDAFTESTVSFLQQLKSVALIDAKSMRFAVDRLSSLLKYLSIENIHEFGPLGKVASFATLLATYSGSGGFSVLYEPLTLADVSVLHLICVDASIAIRSVFQRFPSVIITSGTLSPLEMYPKILGFRPILAESFHLSLARNAISPLIVTRGGDQVDLSSRFSDRSDPAITRNYGQILVEFSRVVPDGLVAFFPSYIYLESVVTAWDAMGVLANVLKYKLIFIETANASETSRVLSAYRRACDSSRGAVLLSVARGRISEGIDFEGHYGRCVLLFGIPYQNTESRMLRERLEFLRDRLGIREVDFLTFDAIRHASQCLGRVLRGKADYGLMVFADRRYARSDKRSKLPRWIDQAISEGHVGLSTETAVCVARQFFREMAQPCDHSTQLWSQSKIDSLSKG